MKVNHIRQKCIPRAGGSDLGHRLRGPERGRRPCGSPSPSPPPEARWPLCFCWCCVWCSAACGGGIFREEAQARPGSWRDLAIGGICCGVVLTMGTNLQQMGLETTTSGKAGFITALYIVIVPIAGIFLRQKGAPGDLAQCGAGGGGIVSAVRAGVLFHHGGGLVRAAVLLLLRRTHPADRPLYPEGGRGGPVLRTVPGDGGALCRS